MALKIYPVVDSFDFHVNKMVPEDDISGLQNHVLHQFPFDDKDSATDLGGCARGASPPPPHPKFEQQNVFTISLKR